MKKTITFIVFLFLSLFTFTQRKVLAYEEVTGNAKILGYSYNFVTSGYLDKASVKAEVSILDRDFLSNIKHMKGEILTGESYEVSGTSVESFRNNLSAEIKTKTGIGGSDTLFSASMQTNFNLVLETEINKYASSFFNQYSSLQIKERYFLPDFKSKTNIYNSNLDKDFENLIISMNNKANNNQLKNSEIDDFFDLYGTHMLHDVLYGGKIEIFQSMHSNKEVYDTKLASDITTDLNFSYVSVLNGNLHASNVLNNKINNTYKSEKTITKITTLGGSSINFNSTDDLANNVNSWYNSINEGNYYPVSLNKNGSMPIWEFLPNKYIAVKDSLEERFEQYAIDNLLYKDNNFKLPKLEVEFEDLDEVQIKSGRFKNESSVFYFNNKVASLAKLKLLGYKNIKVELELNIKEKNDGYQGVLLFSNNLESNDYLIDWVEFEHGGNKKNTTYATHKKTFIFNIDKLTEDNMLVVRYGARGSFSDRWYRKNLKLKITIS